MPISIEADPTLAQGYIKVNGTTAATVTSTGLTTASLQDNAVTTSKVNNAAITAAKLDGAQTGSAPIYGCRAWVNFDGTTVTNVGGEDRCTIRAAGNVSKVVRNGTGDYTVHFTTAMPDANFATIALAGNAVGNLSIAQSATAATASTVPVSVVNQNYVGVNRDVYVAIFR